METVGTPFLTQREVPRAQTRSQPHEIDVMRSILVCLDRSPFSEVCLPYAVLFSKTFGSAITLLHVMQPPHEPAEVCATNALDWEISRREAEAYLDRLEKEVAKASGQRVNTRLEQGHPAKRIATLAHELGADLIVLGSHGEGGMTSWNLGSTVQQVLAVARGSVLVARSTSPAPNIVSPKRILVPLDGSLRTESVLPIVARIAKAHDAEVLLVHVIAEPLPTGILRAAEDLDLARELATRLESRAKRYLEDLRDQLARKVRSVRTVVIRHVDERQSLLGISQTEGIDLVVLLAHGSTCNAARPFGSVAEHLLMHSMVPLLVLQDLPELERSPEVFAEELAPPLRASFTPEVAVHSETSETKA
jgi:nucleotide-binding universal stress UspA family protein